MQKKLTLTIDEQVYEGLKRHVGKRKISKFIEDLVRPHVLHPDLDAGYELMARDGDREKEAAEWSEMTLRDVSDEAR